MGQSNDKCCKADLYRVLDSMNSPCFELNRELEIVYANSALINLSGLNSADFGSVKITDITNSAAEKFKSALQVDAPDSCLIKNVTLTFSGRHFFSGIAINKLHDEAHSVSGLMCTIEGVENFDASESNKRELKKLRAVCIFSGGAAHDYNNALTAVIGNLSLAKLEAEGNQEMIELLKDAETASNRIRLFTEKIAHFARGITITREKCDITRVIRERIDQLSSVYKGVCSLSAGNDLPPIEIDKKLIAEAFECIMENAFEAAPSEDGRINVMISRSDIKDGKNYSNVMVAEGDYISISVSDNGHGFQDSDVDLMFSPYYSTKEGRDGVGLALAYSILKRHRGFINASKAENGGAVFTIYIPLF